jgi:hypothetical protein
MGEQSLGAATPKHVQNAIHNFPSRNGLGRGIWGYRWDQGLQDFPLRIGEVRWIAFSLTHLFFSIASAFTSFSPFLYRLGDPLLTLSKGVTQVFAKRRKGVDGGEKSR